MATRFGAVSPAQTYATKVRWLVACLVSVILVLAVAIIFIAKSTDATENVQPVAVSDPFNSGFAPQVEVLVAAVRIEEGDRITPQMLTTTTMEADKTPMGVARAQDRDQITGKFAKRLINANMALVLDDISENPPVSKLAIPPGYRAVTIMVDRRQGVEGFAKPNSRVDILWTFKQDGKQRVATITRFVKILSVGGATQTDSQRAAVAGRGGTPVTLLVTEQDSRKIELARSLGSLSLILVGDEETSPQGGSPDTITIQDLIGRPATTEAEEVANDGVMYTSDPRTGRQLRYVLRKGRWSLDRSFAGGE